MVENLTQLNIISIITSSITSILSNVFSSIDSNLYSLLDDLLFIDSSVISDSAFIKIMGNSKSGIILICNAILIAIILYYSFSLLLSYITLSQNQSPVSFVFKLFLCAIAINFSYFICEKAIFLVSTISLSIRNIGEQIFNTPICFATLIEEINLSSIFEQNSINIFSFDGLIKTLISVGLLNLSLSYSLRYVMIKVFVLISPFAFSSLAIKNSSWIFKSWIKIFTSLLLLQILVPLILLVAYSLIETADGIFSKIYIIGVIYALIRANSYLKEFMGGITTDISFNLSNLKNSFNGGN